MISGSITTLSATTSVILDRSCSYLVSILSQRLYNSFILPVTLNSTFCASSIGSSAREDSRMFREDCRVSLCFDWFFLNFLFRRLYSRG